MKFSDTKYGDLSDQDVIIKNINIAEKDIDDLTGSPETVRGDFICYTNNLVNLKNSPREIYGFASFSDNMLESLEGNLEIVAGNLDISNNLLKNFKGSLRKVTGSLLVNVLPGFRNKKEIEDSLMEANIIVGGDIVSDFGTFRQDFKKIEEFFKNNKIGVLGKFL